MIDPYHLTLAYVLILIGFLLLAAELFVPASGTLMVLSLAFIGAGIWLSFTAGGPTTGFATLVVVGVALPAAVAMLLRYWPRTRMGQKLFLSGPDDDATVAQMPVNLELEQLRGRVGRAISDLRPSGITDFDGWRVDTITEGLPVEAGHWVRVVDVRAGHVVVRPIDRPELTNLENLDLG